MVSQRVTCPECGSTNRKHGGVSQRADRKENHKCSNCDEWLPCPVCQPGEYPDMDADADNCGPGYFLGESTGECLPCHFCNTEEIRDRQRRYGNARGRV